MNGSLWYKNAFYYEVYVRAFSDSNADGHGDLRGLIEKLDYLLDLGVDCLWLLPFYPSPLRDDGYDIADYYNVLTEYGTLDDIKSLLDEAHKRGLRVITDLVLNHTSDQHAWFQAARNDRNSKYRDYYVWSDTDKKYSQARIIFLDTETSNWTWDEMAGQYYWHRFYSSQPDLNFDNPAVQEAIIDVMRFWLDIGVDGFRMDAVPYLFEREGTNCENLPETHSYLKKIRKFIDENYPDRIMLCEANQWPEEVLPYFGDGDEFHMGFHFPLMPRIFMALKKADRNPLLEIMKRTPAIPENCQWCTFLRNHDELTLEMVTDEERQWMWEVYAPEPRMRLNLGIRRRLAPLLENNQQKLKLAYSLLFSMPGSPIIYYGDEIGMGDNILLPDRKGVRTPMQWIDRHNAGFSDANPERFYAPVIQGAPYGPNFTNVASQRADPESLWNVIKNMIAVRKSHLSFGEGDFSWVDICGDSVAAYWRSYKDEQLLILNNLSENNQHVRLDLPKGARTLIFDLLTEERRPVKEIVQPSGEFWLDLLPYEYRWLEFVV